MAERTGKRRTIRRVILILMIVLAGFLLLTLLLTAVVWTRIFSRGASEQEPLALRYESLEPVETRRTVVFPSGANTLTGYLYEEDNSKGLVVVLHGFRSRADNHLAACQYFAQEGWTVFAFDGTGCGDSQGSGTRGLAQMRFDAEAALAYIDQQPVLTELPLVLYGHSMGAYAAACLSEQADACVCIAGFDKPIQLMETYASAYLGPVAPMSTPALSLWSIVLFGPKGNESAAAAIQESGTPVLLISGTEDTVIPVSNRIGTFLNSEQYTNVRYLSVDETYRNGHSGLWYSGEAAEFSEVWNSETHTDDASEEDRSRANELDLELMEDIQTFLLDAIED